MDEARSWRQSLALATLEILRPGESEISHPTLARVGRIVLTLVIVLTNLIGAAAVLVFAVFVVPLPAVGSVDHVRQVNEVAALIYVAVAVPLGVVLGTRGLVQVREWLEEERQATLLDARSVLHAPLRLFQLQVLLWLVASVLFGALSLQYSDALALRVAIIVALNGVVTASCSYLLSELLLRPAAARAMAQGAPTRLGVPGVATRAVLAWVTGAGLPLAGMVVIGIAALAGQPEATRNQLGVAMVVLGGAGLAVGLLAITVAARATADPVESVGRALERVRQGEFEVRVPVYDGTQIGQLQLGFNAMVQGLAERERIREAFGTYVDPEVAEHILEEGTNLAGEQVEVTIMFVDIRDLTSFAERTAAEEVVSSINALFEQIVPIIHDHGGRVDKFVGDGLLAVFGAPWRQYDHADKALAAALQIVERVRSENGLQIGIGLNSGEVVAGNVGGPAGWSSA
ncbi:MAG: HAMP domain-containing protein [Actinomycetota bacterium]|nr:HAMP domain-containing protein [Actinomycetota bacterium]